MSEYYMRFWVAWLTVLYRLPETMLLQTCDLLQKSEPADPPQKPLSEGRGYREIDGVIHPNCWGHVK